MISSHVAALWQRPPAGLGHPLVANAALGEQVLLAVRMLGEAGFDHVVVNTLPHDIQNNGYVMRGRVPAEVARSEG